MGKKLDLTGRRFGRLVVVGEAGERGEKRKRTSWVCQCDCKAGGILVVLTYNLTGGHTQSCGCLTAKPSNKTHGMSKSKEYKSWQEMKARCLNPNNCNYPRYGGRGIAIYSDWVDSFEVFFRDMGPCPSGRTLERINSDGDYNPSNCCWGTSMMQSNNRSTVLRLNHKGLSLTLRGWSEVTGLPLKTIKGRIRRNWSIEEALDTPLVTHGRCRRGKRPLSHQETARNAVKVAIKRGALMRPEECSFPGCSNKKIEAHHHRGYSPEAYLDIVWLCKTHHPHPNEKIIEWDGKKQTIREWARETGVRRETLYWRLKRTSWKANEKTFIHDNRHRHYIMHEGITLNVAEWARMLGLSHNTIVNRIKKGLPVDKVLAPTRRSIKKVGDGNSRR